MITDLKKGKIDVVIDYLSDKLGYEPEDPTLLDEGKQLAASWSLVDKAYTNADNFIC